MVNDSLIFAGSSSTGGPVTVFTGSITSAAGVPAPGTLFVKSESRTSSPTITVKQELRTTGSYL